MRAKKLVSLGLILVLALSLFVGCSNNAGEKAGNDANSSTNEQEKPVEKIVLKTSTMFGGTDPATEAYKKALSDFMAENPNVEIKDESMTSVGDTFRTKVKTDFSSGNDPDVVFFYTGADAKVLIENQKVMAYDDIWKDYPNLGKDVTQSAKNSMKEADGKIYALPVTGFYEGLFLNKDLFEKNAIELPTSWDKLEAAIKAFNEKGITPIAGPLAQSHYLIEHFILSAAGSEGHKDVFSNGVNPDWVTGLNNIKKFYEEKAFSKDALSLDIEMAQKLFRDEKAAMILEGSWFIGGCTPELQNKMTIVPFPTAPNGKMEYGDVIGGFSSGYYISTKGYNDTAKRDAIVKLVDHLVSADVIKEIAKANGGVPAANVEIDGLPTVAAEGQKMLNQAPHINMPIDSRLTPEAFNILVKEGVPYIVTGEKKADEVLKKVMEAQLSAK